MARAPTRNTRPISPRLAGRLNPVEFLRETVSELRKSVWPSREETARLTMVVIALAIVAAFFLGGLDQLFKQTFNRFVL
jgi:preprotein translocase subunit SecE